MPIFADFTPLPTGRQVEQKNPARAHWRQAKKLFYKGKSISVKGFMAYGHDFSATPTIGRRSAPDLWLGLSGCSHDITETSLCPVGRYPMRERDSPYRAKTTSGYSFLQTDSPDGAAQIL